MIERGEKLPSRNRPVTAGDCLVLVRRRNAFVDELIRALKARGVAVAGIDRLVLTEHIAVMDLMALGQFLLLPGDDLTLATVLKSPLLNFSEEALFDLAYDRGGRSLWSVLSARAGERADFAAAHRYLGDLLARVDFARPFDLYADLLSRGGGRLALQARLGFEALDPIDEFLALALAYEREHVPSLQGFLHWLVHGAVEVKRELDEGARDKVRIMTVHGAKGLQAPIVILPDTHAAAAGVASRICCGCGMAMGTAPKACCSGRRARIWMRRSRVRRGRSIVRGRWRSIAACSMWR